MSGRAPRQRPLRLSLPQNERLVFGPPSLDLAAFHPSAIQKAIKQKTQQMQWRMIVTRDDDCWTENSSTPVQFSNGQSQLTARSS